MTHKMTPQGRPASLGEELQSHSIRLPFSVEPLGKLSELDGLNQYEERPFKIGSREASIEQYGTFYVLHVPGFRTKSDAEMYLERTSAGLLQLAVELEMAIEFDSAPVALDVSEVNKSLRESFAQQNMPSWKRPDGTFTDGGIFPHLTTIVPEHLRVWEYPIFFGKEVKAVSTNQLSVAIENAQEIKNAANLLKDQKLLLAIRTFGAAHNTWDRKTRFVSLVTALEVLKKEEKRADFSQHVIDNLLQDLRSFQTNEEHEKRQLNQLRNDIGNLRQRSISAGICELAYMSRPRESRRPASRAESDKQIKWLYGIRSNLVHEGIVAAEDTTPQEVLTNGLEQLRIVVSEVLRFYIGKQIDAGTN